jgi:hypothetical protein
MDVENPKEEILKKYSCRYNRLDNIKVDLTGKMCEDASRIELAHMRPETLTTLSIVIMVF